MSLSISDIEVFYLSYNEPQKEEFWLDLKHKFPWAIRIDGIKGIDTAHKKCADLSSTRYFITIDGDTKVDKTFFDIEVTIPSINFGYIKWPSINYVNGLMYGNGSIKLWNSDFVNVMFTHENAIKEESKVDFCWDMPLISYKECYATTYINGSILQAYRSGFRESIKLLLNKGKRIKLNEFSKLAEINKTRLLVWLTVGMDVPLGEWAILGAMNGVVSYFNNEFDISVISNYDYFDNIGLSNINVPMEMNKLRATINDMKIFSLNEIDKDLSLFIKRIMMMNTLDVYHT